MQEHPAVLRHPRGLGRRDAGHDDTRREVDLQVRAHELRVRIADAAVLRCGGRDLVGGPRRGVPRVRIVRGDLAAPGPEVGDAVLVLVHVLAGGAAQCGLDEGVDVDRRTEPHPRLDLVVGRPVDPDLAVGRRVGGLLGPGRVAADLLQCRDGRARLGTRHEHDVGGAVDDLLRRVVERELGAVAAVLGRLDRLRVGRADEPRDGAGLVAVRPRGTRHGVDDVGRGEQVGGTPRVAGRPAQGLGRQCSGLEGCLEVGRALHDLTDTDHDRGRRVEHRAGALVQDGLVGHAQRGGTPLEQGREIGQRLLQCRLDAADGRQSDGSAHRGAVEGAVHPHRSAPGVRGDRAPQADRDPHRTGAAQRVPGVVGPLDVPPCLRGDVHQRDLLHELGVGLDALRTLPPPGDVEREPVGGAVEVAHQLGDERGGCGHEPLAAHGAGVAVDACGGGKVDGDGSGVDGLTRPADRGPQGVDGGAGQCASDHAGALGAADEAVAGGGGHR